MGSFSPWPGGIFEGQASSPLACCLLQEVPLAPTPFSVSPLHPVGAKALGCQLWGGRAEQWLYQQGLLEKDLKPDSDARKICVPEKTLFSYKWGEPLLVFEAAGRTPGGTDSAKGPQVALLASSCSPLPPPLPCPTPLNLLSSFLSPSGCWAHS